jgi:hypothetical protein
MVSLTLSTKLSLTKMSDETYVLFCLIEGDSDVFSVTTSPTTPIAELKKLIKEEGIDDNTILAKHLTLWKVRMIMASYSTTNSPAGVCRTPSHR